MSEIIKYENEFATPVTVQQVQQLKSFYKVYQVGGTTKKKEQYKDNKITDVVYYLDVNESESQAASSIASQYQVAHFEIRERETYGVYKIEKAKMYKGNGTYDNHKESEIFDAQGRLICEKIESLFNNVQTTETRKYFYDALQDVTYECLYNAGGTLTAMKGNRPPFVAENDYTIQAAEMSLYFPGFVTQNPYYANATFLP